MRWLRALASLRLTIGLLIVILVILAVGTILDSRSGRDAAAAIYYAGWFQAVLVLYAVNVLAALIDRWPWGSDRIGFALTHGSMLLILLGAAVSHWGCDAGRLALWEGASSAEFYIDEDAMGTLPFVVKLDDFEIDVYPGTQRPAMFRSRLTIEDPATGETFPAIIEMNREFTRDGWSLFQSSYQQSGGREMTILSVSRDPGQPIVFVGYALLVAGMCTVLGTRIRQRRALAEAAANPRLATLGGGGGGAAVLLLAALLGAPPAQAQGAGTEGLGDVALDATQVETLRGLPVQHDGRAMPLDTLAREALRTVTGGESWRGRGPVELTLAWTFDPETWQNRQLVKVGGEEFRTAIQLPADMEHSSFGLLASWGPFLDALREARELRRREAPLSPVHEEALELEGRLVTLQSFLRGEGLLIVPNAGDPVAAWAPRRDLGTPAALVAFLAERRAAPDAPDHYPTVAEIERELTYNDVRYPRLSWWILVPTCLIAGIAWAKDDRRLDPATFLGLFAAFLVMTWGIWTRWQIAGRIPASNMYESLLFLAWGIEVFALVAALLLRNRLVLLNAAAMSALTMILVDRLPIDRFIHPMPPVLSGTPWLAIHVPFIMVSYSVLALGVIVAHMQIGVEIFRPARRDLSARMNDLLYWYIHVGSILLIAGILTGSIWAASSWGRYWGWDPKEVWSLIAFLAYMAILHGRFDRILGTYGVAALSIVAFWTILMTYIGVNYVLAAGLHSYGFGGGGVVRWMLLSGAVEAGFLAAGWAAHRRRVAEGAAA